MTSKSETYRENAFNAAEFASQAKDEPSRKRYERMHTAWLALAEEQDWLDGEVPPVEK